MSDDLEKMRASLKDKLAESNQKLADCEEEEKLEHELAGAANTITTLTSEKDSLLRVQTIQKIVQLKKELEEAGPAAIQKYKASSLYRQKLVEYAAPYMGKAMKLAIEKIKAIYMLPPEADVEEFSYEEGGNGGDGSAYDLGQEGAYSTRHNCRRSNSSPKLSLKLFLLFSPMPMQ